MMGLKERTSEELVEVSCAGESPMFGIYKKPVPKNLVQRQLKLHVRSGKQQKLCSYFSLCLDQKAHMFYKEEALSAMDSVTPRLGMIDAFWYSPTHSSKEDFPPSAHEKKPQKEKNRGWINLNCTGRSGTSISHAGNVVSREEETR